MFRELIRNPARFSKFYVALAGAAVAVATAYLGADSVHVTALVGVLTALGVYQVPNR